jgi:hypothetical protein
MKTGGVSEIEHRRVFPSARTGLSGKRGQQPAPRDAETNLRMSYAFSLGIGVRAGRVIDATVVRPGSYPAGLPDHSAAWECSNTHLVFL